MARRSSMKRLSRDSRYSMLSEVLDADTNNLGDEHVFWWKKLENNTLVRQSVGSNALYQSSRHLNSNSSVRTGDAENQWWDILNTLDVDSRAIATNQAKEGRTDNAVSMSESEEEPRVAKKKFPLRSEAKKSEGNAFLNILDHSQTAASEPVRRSGSRNSLIKSVANERATDSELVQGNSMHRSKEADDILKLKHRALRNNQRRNIFDDVSKENDFHAPSKSTSLRKSLLSKSQTLVEKEMPGATESPIIRQGGSRQLVSSFESEHDIPAPEAQSTLLASYTNSIQASNRDINSSDTEVILKPKPKLLTRQNKSTKKNVFEDILAKEETRDDKEGNKSTDTSNTANTDVSENPLSPPNDPSKASQSVPRNASETKDSNAKVIKKAGKVNTIVLPSQNAKQSVEHDKLIEDSVASSDTSSSSRKLNNIQKPKSQLLKTLRRSPRQNIFEDVFKEDDDVKSPTKSRFQTTLDRREDLADKNQEDSASEELNLQLPDSPKDVKSIRNDEGTLKINRYNSDAAVSKVVLEPSKQAENRVDSHLSSGGPEIPSRRTVNSFRNPSRSQRQSTSSEMREAQVEENVGTPRRRSRYSSTSQKQVSSMRDQIEPDKAENAIERHENLIRSKRWLALIDRSESASAEEDQSTLKRRSRLSEKSKRQVSLATNEVEPEEIDNDTKRQGGNLSKSQKQSASGVANESKEVETQTSPKRRSRISRKSLKPISSLTNEVEPDEIKSTPKREGRSLSKSQNEVVSNIINDFETDVELSPKSQRRRGINLSITDESKREENRSTQKRQSKASNKSKVQVSPIRDELESDVTGKATKRQSRDSKAPQRLIPSDLSISKSSSQGRSVSTLKQPSDLSLIESKEKEDQNTPKRQSKDSNVSHTWLSVFGLSTSQKENSPTSPERQEKRFNRSKKGLDFSNVDGAKEKEQSTLKRQSRASNKSEKQVFPATNEVEPGDIGSNSKRQSENQNRSQRWLTVFDSSTSEEESSPTPPKRQGRSSNRSRKGLDVSNVDRSKENDQNTPERQSSVPNKSHRQISPATNEVGTGKKANAAKRRSRELSNSRKRSTVFDASTSEEENSPTRPGRQGRSSSRLKKGLDLGNVDGSMEKEQSTSRRQNRASNKPEKQVSPTTNKLESGDIASKTNRQSENINRSQRWLSAFDMSSSEEESSPTPSERQERGSNKSRKGLDRSNKKDQTTPERQSRASNKSQEQIIPTINKLGTDKNDSATERQSKDSSNSQRRPTLFDAVTSEEENLPPLPRRQERSSIRSRKESDLSSVDESKEKDQCTPEGQSSASNRSQRQVSPATKEIGADKNDSATEKQSKELSNSQGRLTMFDVITSEEENPPTLFKRQARSSGRVKEVLDLNNVDGSKEKDQSTPKRQSKRRASSKSKKQAFITNKVGTDKKGSATKRQSKQSSKSQRKLTSLDMGESKTEDIPRRQTRSSTRLKALQDVGDQPEMETGQNILKKQNTPHRPTSFAANETEAVGTDILIRNRSRELNELQERLTVHSASDLELNDTQQSPRKKSKNSRPEEPESAEVTGKQGEVSDSRKSATGTAESINRNALQDDANSGRNSLSRTEKQINVMELRKRFTFTPNIVDEDDQIPPSAGTNEAKEDASAVSTNKQNLDKPEDASGDVNERGEASASNVLQRINDKRRSVAENRRKTVGKARNSIPVTSVTADPTRIASKGQRNILDFVKIGTFFPASQGFADKQKEEEMKQKLGEIEKPDQLALRANRSANKNNLPSQGTNKNAVNSKKKTRTGKQRLRKQVHKAFLVNGQEYRIPRLLRPKYWITDHFYNHLWKCLEPRYKLGAKVVSEKFVLQLAEVTTFIEKSKSYLKYKAALHALMKEMARLGIIRNRLDFYHFCQDFFPSELRFKTIPMLLPGNKTNIPYSPDGLNEPLLEEE